MSLVSERGDFTKPAGAGGGRLWGQRVQRQNKRGETGAGEKVTG